MNLEEIKKFVKNKHGNQRRKHGTPYYLHPFAVADILEKKGYNLDYQIAGLFHDLLEDTDVKYEEILKLSSANIADAVKLLSKEEGYEISDYINRIDQNEIAKAVKLADRVHNLSEAYLVSNEFIQKYIEETKKWYLQLAKGTVFESEIKEALERLEGIIC